MAPNGTAEQENPAKHVVIDVVDEVSSLTKTMRQRLEKTEDADAAASTPSIHKVHPDVRKQDAAAYDPQFISIGPFHHKKKGLEATEDLKWRYLRDLLRRSKSSEEDQLREYIAEMWKEEKRATSEYATKIELEPRGFVEMLVLDGCFIIEFLIKRASGPITGLLTATKWNLPFLRRDLLLLENQIPFFVLQALFDKSHFRHPAEINDSVTARADGQISTAPKTITIQVKSDTPGEEYCYRTLPLMDLALHYINKKVEPRPANREAAKHLLHLSHICLLENINPENQSEQANQQILKAGDMISKKIQTVAGKLLRSTYSAFLGCILVIAAILLMCDQPRRNKKRRSDYPREIPRAKELWEAGVLLRRRKGGSSNCCLLDVSFSQEDGRMEIPFFSIEEHTNSRYRNLIAFEQCSKGVEDKRFTSYAIFLSNVVDKEEDVALLKEKEILESKLGSDEETAKFFNKVVEGAVLDYKTHYLKEVYMDVRLFCDEDKHKWRAKLAHDYFKSPWTKLSLVATLLAFAIAITQVTFTIIRHVHS